MSSPEATSGVPTTTPADIPKPEGPIPAPSQATSYIVPNPPAGNNSAPPAVSTTPPTKKEGMTFQDLIVSILYLIFTGYAIYYGWILGQRHGGQYLAYVQSIGIWLRSWFVRPV
jgi:hypothetical protein